MITRMRIASALFFILAFNFTFGQAPNISYTSPQVYTVQTAISPLAPTNSGGAVPTGAITTLPGNFNNLTGVAADAAGNVYVAENGSNDVREILAGGSVITLGLGFSNPPGVAVDAAGNVYVTDFGNNAVKKISAGNGTVTTVATGFNGPYGIAIDAAGNLYVSDFNNNAVEKIAAGGGTAVAIGSGFSNPTGVAVDGAGNVYVTDRGHNAIKEILVSNGTTVTLSGGNGNPNGVAVDASGNVYFADTNLSTITEIPVGGGSNIVIGSGFSTPTSVAVDAAGDIFIGDNGNRVVKEIAFGGYKVSPALPAGLSMNAGTGVISGTPTAASPATNYTVTATNNKGSGTTVIQITVNLPAKPIISYSTPQVYTATEAITPLSPNSTGGPIPSSGAFSVSPSLPSGLRLDVNTGIISGTPINVRAAANYTVTATNMGGSGTAVINITIKAFPVPTISYHTPDSYPIGFAMSLSPASSGVGASGSFSNTTIGSGLNNLTGVASDAAGNVYVAENGNSDVKKIPANGGSIITLGSGFNHPTGVAADAAGNVYVADNGNNAIKEIPAGNGAVVTISASFNGPYGVAIDAAGNIYVGDANNNLVKKIPAGSTTPVAIGSGFNHPTGVAVDASGNVYVADRGNNAIKEILAGSNNTITLASGSGNPNGVAVDAGGNVYFADTNNGAISEIPAGGGGIIAVGSGFSTPTAVAVSAQNSDVIYVDSNGDGTVKRVTPTGGYFISPALPAGMSISPGTGVITGTPSAVSPATNYTVKAFNAGGSSSTTVNIATYTPNGGLANLSLSAGTLSPAFATAVTNYSATVDNSVSSVTVTPTASTASNTITVNGTAVVSGNASAPVALNFGSNKVEIIVKSSTSQIIGDYFVNVFRSLSSNANLQFMSVSAGSLTPAFATSTTAYSVGVPDAVTSFSVTPVSADGTATIRVNNQVTISGSVSSPIALSEGSNTVTVMVTAQDNTTTKIYTITVIRSSNDQLSKLTISKGTLSPAFSTTTTSYSDLVTNGISSITVTPTLSDPNARVTVNGAATTSGSASSPVALNAGANTISIVVTAPDGTTTQTYTVTVTRAGNTNDNLSSLKMSKGTFSPVFAGGTTSYTDAVANIVTSVTVTPTASDPGATIQVNGAMVPSGTASGAINLAVGPNTVNVVVKASDGATTKTYTITVTRAPSSNAGLANIALSLGTLSPDFATTTTAYTASVANATTSITLTPTTADPTASVQVNGTTVNSGTASGAINLNVGPNTITMIVTAQDGATNKTYTVTVTRDPSANDDLSSLKMSKGVFSPTFVSGTTSYTDAVGNTITAVTVTPTTADATATVKVNGTPVTSGTASNAINLNVGPNTINVVVTAQDGTTTQTYTVTVTRAGNSNDNLTSLKMSKGIFSPTFTSTTTGYTDAVGNTITSVSVTPTTSDPDATVKVNGTAVSSGTASGAVNLAVGANTIQVAVTASDNVTTKTYTVTVNRASGGADSYTPITMGTGISVNNPAGRPSFDDDIILVHQGLSPNGDGVNDFLTIDGIQAYPDNKLSIMNRNGQLVYEASGYDNATKVFDGHSNKNGQMQLPGTYFYQLDYTANGITKHKTGFLVLKY